MARSILHILLGVLLWVVFGWYWHLVMQRPVTPGTKHALGIVSLIVGTITVFDCFWIIHNLRISRRDQRRDRRATGAPPEGDFLGRRFVVQNEELLRRARYVEVDVVDMADSERHEAGYKLFRINDVIPD